MPFTHRNLKQDLQDVGSNFDGAPGLEGRRLADAAGQQRLHGEGVGWEAIPTL